MKKPDENTLVAKSLDFSFKCKDVSWTFVMYIMKRLKYTNWYSVLICIPYHHAFQSGKEDDTGGKNAGKLTNLDRRQIER